MLRFYTPVFALTLLLSAALIFVVQPMFSKMILPLLGGTPQVWNTAMLFFQAMLLVGYAYAHGTTKTMSVRMQAILHLALLVLFFFILPIAIPEGWEPPTDKNPTFWQLSLMTIVIGGPFFVLAGSAPMLQRWFAHTDHPDADNPYFLYGASNLGSMAALLAYPVLIEPLFDLPTQSALWSTGYVGLALMTIACAALVWPSVKKISKNISVESALSKESITWKRRLTWLVLAFIPSSLMLGVTTYLTTDIASVPLLWVIPLALYVGTFVIVFARKPIIGEPAALKLQGIFLLALMAATIAHLEQYGAGFIIYILIHLFAFFFCALGCHSQLARLKPEAVNLTEFYFIMSIGGVLGGVFNAIIAPQIFTLPLEYPLALIAAAAVRYITRGTTAQNRKKFRKLNITFALLGIATTVIAYYAFDIFIGAKGDTMYDVLLVLSGIVAMSLAFTLETRWYFTAIFSFILLFLGTHKNAKIYEKYDIMHQQRNFFGVLKVVEFEHERAFMHGTTHHGNQALDEKYKLEPLSYYSYESPIRDVLQSWDTGTNGERVAVAGLGAGVVACFAKENRHYDFYEIDPDVVAIAENPKFFTLLRDCGSPYDIILGDARLQIAKALDQYYDLIMLDAFSSDNIPVHLLTQEAIRIYLQKLKPGGALIFNVSNRYLDIEPVLAGAAQDLNIHAVGKLGPSGKLKKSDIRYFGSHWVVLTKNTQLYNFLIKKNWTPAITRERVNIWTDQFSNILSILYPQTVKQRTKILKEQLKASPSKR